MKVDLKKINAGLKSRHQRTNQNVPLEAKKVAELKRETIKLEAQARELKRQSEKLKGAAEKLGIKAPAKPAPAKQAQASRKVVVDGEEVTLSPGEEVCRLVVPRSKPSK